MSHGDSLNLMSPVSHGDRWNSLVSCRKKSLQDNQMKPKSKKPFPFEKSKADKEPKGVKENSPKDKSLDKKQAPLGSGQRFKAVEESAAKSGAKNPAAVAAAVGFKKYGKQKMESMAQAGKRKKK